MLVFGPDWLITGHLHEAALAHAAADGELWNLWYTSVPAPGQTRAYIETALDMRDRQGAMPFAVREAASGEILYHRADAP